jgi:pimeloyl-ACP methyl ester carboxylesterase
MRYKPDGLGPGFPPHTPTTLRSAPGLLHVAARDAHQCANDFLFADAPGEWFRAWAINQGQPGASGARWITEHADCFIIFADSDALSGADRGNARDDLFKLALRLSSHIGTRPVAVVWSKHDKVVPPSMREQIDTRLAEYFPGAKIFNVSAVPPASPTEPAEQFIAVLRWLLAQPQTTPGAICVSTNRPAEPFFAFRGHRA